MRASTPVRLVRATRLLARRLSWERDLLLLEVGRAGSARTPRVRAALGIRSSSLAELVRRMEGEGLLERRRAPDDGRIWLLRLTPAGREAASAAAEAWRAVDDRLLGGLTREERDELRRLLRKAGRALAGGGSRL